MKTELEILQSKTTTFIEVGIADPSAKIFTLSQAIAAMHGWHMQQAELWVNEKLNHQDAIICKLTREKQWLEDSLNKWLEWLRLAKLEAGYHDIVSFDIVWKEALTALKESRAKNAQAKPSQS